MAAGMNAQQRETKLSRIAEEAKKAWLDEKDPDKSSKLHIIWKEAEDRLERFPNQQMAGGKIPTRAARFDLHGVVRLAGGAVQGPAIRAGRGPRAWACKGICVSTPSELPTSCRVSRLAGEPVEKREC